MKYKLISVGKKMENQEAKEEKKKERGGNLFPRKKDNHDERPGEPLNGCLFLRFDIAEAQRGR